MASWPRELAEDDRAAADRVGEQQQQRAALGLAGDGVVREQERDQRHEEDGEAGEADRHHVEPAGADGPGGRAAEQRQRKREGGEQQRGGEHPAVAETLANLLAGEGQDGVHGPPRPGWAGGGFRGEADHHAASRRRKCV